MRPNGAAPEPGKSTPPPPSATGGAHKRSRGSTHTADARELVLLASSLTEESAASFKQAARTLPGASVVRAWSDRVTHVVTEPIVFEGKQLACRTLKHLCAILSGQWIVSSAWLKASLDRGCWLPEQPYELDGDMSTRGQDGPRKGREAHAAGGAGIFQNVRVYLHGKFVHPNPSKQQLVDLLQLGGASVCASLPALHSKPHDCSDGTDQRRSIVVCDAEEATAELVAKCAQHGLPVLSPKWLMDSISHVQCLDFGESLEGGDYRLG
jgi:hypothetical protein